MHDSPETCGESCTVRYPGIDIEFVESLRCAYKLERLTIIYVLRRRVSGISRACEPSD